MATINRQPTTARSSQVEICIDGILEWQWSTNPSHQVQFLMRLILSILSLILFILSPTTFAQTPSPTDHVKTVQDDARVKAAFDHIDKNKDAILREWIAITEINAPSKQEKERAKFIESLLRKHKLDIRYDSAGNLIATRQGTGGGPVTVFDAHMDTVFQPGLKIKATVRDGRVYAPGIGDDTRNIEALLATLRALDAAFRDVAAGPRDRAYLRTESADESVVEFEYRDARRFGSR